MEILYFQNPNHADNVEQFSDFLSRENSLQDTPIEEIVDIFNSISLYWTSKECQVRDLLVTEGMGFIVPWLKRANITKLLNQNFPDYTLLDDPKISDDGQIYYARPCGTAVHWIAGNVPVLGVISLFQTLLTKNRSIVKVPSSYKQVLPQIFRDLESSSFFKDNQKSTLNKILYSTLILYTDRDDVEWQNLLSQNADIRVAWGGTEAIASIVGLQKKINARDLIYGPKVSLAVASKKMIESSEGRERMAKLLADDVFPFDQAGCNAPHNLIIENCDKISTEQLAAIVHEEFEKKVNKLKPKKEPIDSFNIILKKFIYQSSEGKKAISSEFNNSNVFSSEGGVNVEDPLYSRSIFISSVKNIEDLATSLPHNIQSVGLYVEQERKIQIIKILSNFGVDRFPDLGKMALYQNPWDGYLPLQSMVKWISTN